VAGLDQPVRVIRDVDGIAHLSAVSEHDLYFMQGWIHAEDRLFQMDVFRRQASGTLAELFGAPALASDVELRTLGLRRAAERSLAVVSDPARADLEAYAEGVNAWVASHPLPPEYGVLELTTFQPWDPVDSLVIAKLIAFGLSFDLDVESTVVLQTYVTAGDAVGFDGTALFFEDLFRSAPFDAASTVPDALNVSLAPAPGAVSGPGNSAQMVAQAAREISPAARRLMRQYLDRVREVPLLEAAVRPSERQAGSNEWAVAGRHTADGRPLIANDPHLALDVPATFHAIHLRDATAGVNVIGEGFAGVPYVILGQNQWISWGATTNPMDVTDTFLEQVVPDPDSPSGLSTVYQGDREPVIPMPLEFRLNEIGDGIPDNLVPAPAGTVPPFVLIVPRRNQGPIVALDAESGTALSVQYTGFSATREIDAFRIWNRARSLNDFVDGLQFFDVGSQNWVFTDQWGNIAYFTSAEMPLREDLQAGFVDGLPPFFLREGTGGNEWLPVEEPEPGQAVPYAILPFAEMPQVVQPPSGFFVNANNDPAGTTLDNDPLNQVRPGGGLYYLNPGYAAGFRAGRITQRLGELLEEGGVTVADMQSIQADVRLLDAEVFTPHILQAWENATRPEAPDPLAALATDPRLEEAVGRLAGWDQRFPTGIAEGWDANDSASGLSAPSPDEIASSVVATIYSVWRGQLVRNTIDATLEPLGLPGSGSNESLKLLRHLLDTFDEGQGVGASGLDFFPGASPTAADRRDEVILKSLGDALDLLVSDAFEPAFGGSTDQDDYRWGLLHRIRFDHPLGGPFSIPPAGGAIPEPLPGLPGIPVDGGFGAVDASSHSARADGVNEFMFGSGPVRRYVARGGGGRNGLEGVSSMPGGTSGVLGSPFYANLLPGWLANEEYPVRFRHTDVVAARLERIVYVPSSD
jgi:penicillin amidase